MELNPNPHGRVSRNRMLWAMVLVAALLLFVLVGGVWQSWTLQGDLSRQATLVDVSAREHDWLLQLVNEETGVRGYVATNDPRFLQIYYASMRQDVVNEATLTSQLDAFPRLEPTLAAITVQANRVRRYFKDEIQLVESGDASRARTNLSRGKVLFDNLRDADFTAERATNVAVQRQRSRTVALVRAAFATGLVLIAALVLFVVVLAVTLRRAHFYHLRSMRDELTGAGNRLRAITAIRELLREHVNEEFAVLFIDLDGFKAVNDTYGHAAGDAILQSVAARLRNELRDTDVVCRLGGDEFACIIGPPTDIEKARSIAARLRKAIAQPYTRGDERYVIDCSAGVSLYPFDGTTVDALLARADSAMYAVKKSRS